jgi:xanthine dehydrogenase YagS FAD-binding subunit
MKAFTSNNPRSIAEAVTALKNARGSGKTAMVAGGGSDLLGMMKERLVTPDLVVRLAAIRRLDQVTRDRNQVAIGGQITLHTLAQHADVRRQLTVLAEAAESVATPQVRNVGTLAGNVCQRPWCWYYRNGFKCFKNGGNTCFSVAGENQFHAIFGGGPSYIVHPSDTAPALEALDAQFHLSGPGGDRTLPAAEFFTLPSVRAAYENALKDDEVLASISIPAPAASVRSLYHKVMDREAWTHAIISAAVVLDVDGDTCKSARIVLGGVAPTPWRLSAVETMLTGQRITPELIERAATASTEGARPLARNAYKIPLTQAVVRRALTDLVARTA